MQERWQEIQAIWQNNQVLYVIAGFLAGILFFPAIEALNTDAGQLLAGFVPEAVGITFTVLLIDRLYERRERRREQLESEAKLVREAGSRVNHISVQAIDEIRKRGKLIGEDSLLQGKHFSHADMRNAPLSHANLQEAQLGNVDLQNTMLWRINLRHAYVVASYLQGAWLVGADLSYAQLWASFFQGAQLDQANLENANLFNTRLQNTSLRGAILRGANLEDAALQEARFDERTAFDDNTQLPDGTYWTPETDMTRFTDPNHPEFWEPDWVKATRK